MSTAVATAASAASVDLCDEDDALEPECSASEASDACDDGAIAIVGVQAVLDEQIRAAGNELAGELDKTIAMTQAWRRQQQEKFEVMRMNALAELAASAGAAQPADEDDVPLPRCKPRQCKPWASTTAEGDENAGGMGSPRPRLLEPFGPAVSMGEVEPGVDLNRANVMDATPEDAKALAAAVAARTEMLKLWDEEMDDLSRNLQNHLDVLSRVQALDG